MDDRPQREMSLMEYVEIANLPKSHRIWREFNELQRQAEEIEEAKQTEDDLQSDIDIQNEYIQELIDEIKILKKERKNLRDKLLISIDRQEYFIRELRKFLNKLNETSKENEDG